ncbi:hypothetical protein UCRPC4_g06227 [Phaeomoniella chlamydospora]|uniref:Uncharacterized protein n=1 Tax=Phaeomoniella chlamydospora TaxID=158046 RepID=A0A0G2GF00_PHACM|nr:hypothetical protein UCRPC4_g06227 [Phaeomoniella chlamydospora]
MSGSGHSKVPQTAGASEKFLKKDAQAHGFGASNAPAHKDQPAPGERPVASDSGKTNGATNVPGEKGIGGVDVREEMENGRANMK